MLKAQRLDDPASTGRAGKRVASLVVIIAVVSSGPVKQGQLGGRGADTEMKRMSSVVQASHGVPGRDGWTG